MRPLLPVVVSQASRSGPVEGWKGQTGHTLERYHRAEWHIIQIKVSVAGVDLGRFPGRGGWFTQALKGSEKIKKGPPPGPAAGDPKWW